MKSNVNEITAGVMIKLKDDITTNDVITLDENNINTLAKKCFNKIDEGFIDRVTFNEGGFIVAGEDFLEGTSDEIVAKVFSNLKIKGIIAKSFNQMYKENLIKNDIIPMEFVNADEYEKVGLYDILKLKNLYEDLPKGILEVINITKGSNFWVKL